MKNWQNQESKDAPSVIGEALATHDFLREAQWSGKTVYLSEDGGVTLIEVTFLSGPPVIPMQPKFFPWLVRKSLLFVYCVMVAWAGIVLMATLWIKGVNPSNTSFAVMASWVSFGGATVLCGIAQLHARFSQNRRSQDPDKNAT
jgi:hypothetical protein